MKLYLQFSKVQQATLSPKNDVHATLNCILSDVSVGQLILLPPKSLKVHKQQDFHTEEKGSTPVSYRCSGTFAFSVFKLEIVPSLLFSFIFAHCLFRVGTQQKIIGQNSPFHNLLRSCSILRQQQSKKTKIGLPQNKKTGLPHVVTFKINPAFAVRTPSSRRQVLYAAPTLYRIEQIPMSTAPMKFSWQSLVWSEGLRAPAMGTCPGCNALFKNTHSIQASGDTFCYPVRTSKCNPAEEETFLQAGGAELEEEQVDKVGVRGLAVAEGNWRSGPRLFALRTAPVRTLPRDPCSGYTCQSGIKGEMLTRQSTSTNSPLRSLCALWRGSQKKFNRKNKLLMQISRWDMGDQSEWEEEHLTCALTAD